MSGMRAKQFGMTKGLSIVLAIFAGCLKLCSHPISLTSAQFEIEEDAVRVRVTVMLEDLVLLYSLQPNDEGGYSSKGLLRASESHEEFLLERLILLNGDGQKLAGRFSSADRSSIDATVVPEALMEYSIVYEFEYSLSSPLKLLTIVQRFAPEDASLPAIMDLTIRRGGEWVHRPSQLVSDQALTVNLERNGLTEPGETQWEALRRRKEAEARLRLGISSYAGLYSFIYVTEAEVRHEVLVPLLTLEEWLPLARASNDMITVEEQRAAVPEIESFFREGAPAWINEKRTEALVDRIQFFGVDLRDFARNVAPRDVSVYQARVGIILSYRRGERPQNVELEWNSFGPRALAVQSTVLIGDAFPEKFRFWKGNRRWKWTSDSDRDSVEVHALESPPRMPVLRLPLLSLIAILIVMIIGVSFLPGEDSVFKGSRRWLLVFFLMLAAGMWPSDRFALFVPRGISQSELELDSIEIGNWLLSTVYSAFNEGGEEAAYDRLEGVVIGDLLESLYFDFRRALTFREQGGAMATVKSIEVLSFEPIHHTVDQNGRLHLLFDARWRAEGSVEHWGHVHRRRLDYHAQVSVFGAADAWRIEALDVLEENRSPMETSIRRLR